MDKPQNSPSHLIAALSALINEHPAYAPCLKPALLAVIESLGPEGDHKIILSALEDGANTYADLRDRTGFNSVYLHRKLKHLIKAGMVEVEDEPPRGNFRPRKLFFTTENKVPEPNR